MSKRLVSMLVFALAVSLVAARPKDEAKKKAPAKKEAHAKKEAPPKKGPDVAGGQDLFKSNCAVCHYADSTDKRIGPGLKGLYQREKMFDGRPINDENIRDLILNGGGKMIPFKEKLDDKQLDDLVAYLHTL